MHSLVQATILVLVVFIGSENVFVSTLPQLQSQMQSTSSSSSSSSSSEVNFGSITPLFDPSNIQPCNISTSNKDECIQRLFEVIVPQLKSGIPEFNMASIDPYFYKKGIFRYANDGVQGGLLIKNMNIFGISSLRCHKIQINFTDSGLLAKINASIPKLQAEGFFKADVKFGGLRLVPKGQFNITIDNVRTIILTSGVIETTEIGSRVKLQRLNANVAVGETKIDANGIFSDRNLNAMILNLVNENLPEIVRVGIPATRDQWAPILVQHINNFFVNVPLEKFIIE